MMHKQLVSLLAIASLATYAVAVPLVKVVNANAGVAIPDNYIVVLKDTVSDAQFEAHTRRINSKAAGRPGANRKRGLRRKMKGKAKFKAYAGEFDKTTLKDILKDPEVDYVEQDAKITINYNRTAEHLEKRVYRKDSTWGLDRVSHTNFVEPYRYYYNDAYNGEGATVYVIDTGIQAEHSEFADLYTGKTRVRWGINTVEGNTVNNDENGHGTHCAGTIGGLTVGINRKVNLVAVKVLDADGSGTWSGIIAGINWVGKDAKSGYSVASMSLGGSYSKAVNKAVDDLVNNSGVTVVVAAGNEDDDAAKSSPASASQVITVGAIDEYTDSTNSKYQNMIAEFSNWGSTVDIFAPGVNIRSSILQKDKKGKLINNAYDAWSGTSMATPHVAGLAAYFISKAIKEGSKGVKPATLRDTILSNAVSGQISGNLHGAPNLIATNNYCNPNYACDS